MSALEKFLERIQEQLRLPGQDTEKLEIQIQTEPHGRLKAEKKAIDFSYTYYVLHQHFLKPQP